MIQIFSKNGLSVNAEPGGFDFESFKDGAWLTTEDATALAYAILGQTRQKQVLKPLSDDIRRKLPANWDSE